MASKTQKMKIKCFSRVQIVNEDGSLHGDSGWTGPNLLTNLGIANFLAGAMAANAGSKQVNFMALGSGTLVASDGTTLPGEVMASTARHSITSRVYSSRTLQAGSGTQYFYATFTSGWITGAGSNLSNVGLYATSDTNATLFCGNTFASSACASNQAVNVTYQIQLG
jgi:hypothetical protein